jgi:hypothetical protein
VPAGSGAPRLVLLCGLPGSGKTTLAREIADAYGAVRLNPDEWETALDVDPFDEPFQTKLEAKFWELAQRLLALGVSVVLELGSGLARNGTRSARRRERSASPSSCASSTRHTRSWSGVSSLATPPAASPSPRATWSGIEPPSSRRPPMSSRCMTHRWPSRVERSPGAGPSRTGVRMVGFSAWG